MNKFSALFINDLRNTRRDPTLLILMLLPILMIAFVRLGIPYLTGLYPVVLPYVPLGILIFAVLNAAFPAFVIAFMMLDERDLGISTALNITPISGNQYLLSRLMFITLFGWLNATIFLLLNGQIIFLWWQAVVIALLSAMVSPSILFSTLLLAKNKIEGVTIMKIMNVSIMLPIAAQFTEQLWRYLFVWLPAFWVYETTNFMADTFTFLLHATIGVILVLGVNFLFFRLLLKRYR